jgi:hypothetical protein
MMILHLRLPPGKSSDVAFSANLCGRGAAAEERCLHRGNQYASHHGLHFSDAAIRPSQPMEQTNIVDLIVQRLLAAMIWLG